MAGQRLAGARRERRQQQRERTNAGGRGHSLLDITKLQTCGRGAPMINWSAMTLHRSQAAALAYVSAQARARAALARATLDEVAAMANLGAGAVAGAMAAIRQHARVALHFHPDRPDGQLRSVAEALLDGGVYKSQFETLLSNGSV